jgi:transposase
MKRFVEGEDRRQTTLLPDCIEDYVSEENPVRVIEAFVAALDLAELGFEGVVPERTGRPAYHPATLLKLYVYGYLNRIQSSRRLEREAGRNLELMWLAGRLTPDFKTIADFRKDNGAAIRATCRRFVLLCRDLDPLSEAAVAIDSSKFEAVNAREMNYTPNVVRRRMEQAEASVQRYLAALDTADRQEQETARARTGRLKDRLAGLARRMEHLREMEAAVRAAPDGQVSLTDPDARAMATSGKDTGIVGYNVQAAVDTKHHLVVAHEVTNASATTAPSCQGWPSRRVRPWATRPSPSSPTGATSTARRSSPASGPASRRSCPSR